MKLLFFSDVHGVPAALEQFFAHAAAMRPDRLVFLGDALYHGPRNGVPSGYDPRRAADIFNAHAAEILAVRGNCDADVDQFMLHFPILSDCSEILAGSTRFFLTHGHVWNAAHLPPIPVGTVLVHGHTHIPELVRRPDGITIFNPGSISLPKNGNPPTFGLFDGSTLSVLRLADAAPVFSLPV